MTEWLVELVVTPLAKGQNIQAAIIGRVAINVMAGKDDDRTGTPVGFPIDGIAELALLAGPGSDMKRYRLPIGRVELFFLGLDGH
jgi:hypothetical protein